MKKIYFLITILSLLGLIFTACSEDGIENLAKEFKLSTYEVILDVGTQQQLEVLSGNGGYKAEVSSDNVKAEFKEGILYIDATKEGELTIKVTDAAGEKATVKVNVFLPKFLKLSINELTLEKGVQERIKVLDGNGGYKIEVSNDNVKAEFKDGEIYVEIVKEGESIITVTDKKGKEALIKVLGALSKEIKLSTSDLNLTKGNQEKIKILDGNGGYKFQVSNDNIKVEFRDTDIHVEAIKQGESTIKITDLKGKETLVNVVVFFNKVLKLSTSELNFIKGGQEKIKIIDGNGDYKVKVSNNLVKAEVKDGEIYVEAIKKGLSTITVTDAKGEKASVKVVVFLPKDIKLGATDVTLKKGNQEKVKIIIGNGGYRVVVSNNNIKAEVTGGYIRIDALKEGTSTIKVTDVKGKTASIKVVVSLTRVLKLSNFELTIEKGLQEKIEIIDGNGGYKIIASSNNFKAELKNSFIYVNALKEGIGTIKVTDAKGKTVSVKIIVSLTKVLKLGSYELIFEKGEQEKIKIIDGNGAYKVKVSNNNIKAQFKDGIIYVEALEAGESTITVTDAKGKIASVKVVISLPKELKLSASELTLEKGDEGKIKIIEGNGTYKVEVSNNNVKAEFKDGIIYVDALEGGDSTITVTDAKGKRLSVKVVISLPKELKLSASELTLEKGAKTKIQIIDGNGGYQVIVSNNNVKSEFKDGAIYVEALEGGESTIKITDAKGKIASVKVIVSLPKELKLSTANLILEKGNIKEIKIIDGNGGYQLEVSKNNIEVEFKNGSIYVTALEGGEATIRVTDTKGKKASVKVIVSLPKELKLSMVNLIIEKGNTKKIKILDGNDGYQFRISNTNVNTELRDGVIYVNALEEGSSTIRVTDAKGKEAFVYVTINSTVVVNPGFGSIISSIHRIKIVSQQGHRHGTMFHGNPENGSPLKAYLYTILEKDTNGNWSVIKKAADDLHYIDEGESFVFESVSFSGGSFKKGHSPVQGYEFIFYNKNGERLDNKILNKNNVFQNLFSIEKYNELDDNFQPKKEVNLSSMKSFMEYNYRDTDPADKMLKLGGTLTDSFLGLKGYGWVKKNRVSYKLKVTFVEFKDQNSKVNSIYLEDANTSKIKEQISFEIPVIIPAERDDYDTRIDGLAKFYNMTYTQFEDLFWESAPAESSQYWM